MEENKNIIVKPIKASELAWYIISGILALAGLVFVTFGIIGANLQVKASENWVTISENAWLTNWSGLGWRWWGLILIAVSVIVLVISTNVFAREGDRDSERAARRARRLNKDTAPQAPVVDAEVVENN